MTKIKIISIILFIAVILVGGIYYLSQKNNWGCALDSQGIQIYVKASDLSPYLDFKDQRNGQMLNDWNVLEELKNKDIAYAQDSNDCYGKHIYKIKINNELTVVDSNRFYKYLNSEISKNFCSEGVKIRQNGNSPLFVDYRVCPGV